MQAGIEKLHVEGRIRITFDPLVDKLPVIGAVKVSENASPWMRISQLLTPAHREIVHVKP